MADDLVGLIRTIWRKLFSSKKHLELKFEHKGKAMGTVSLTTAEKSLAALTLKKNSDGSAVSFSGTPTWESDNPAVATVSAIIDPKKAEVKGVGPGTANITATIVIGGTTYTATGVATVSPEPMTLVMDFGAPQPK